MQNPSVSGFGIQREDWVFLWVAEGVLIPIEKNQYAGARFKVQLSKEMDVSFNLMEKKDWMIWVI